MAGIPRLGLYLVARESGPSVQINPAGLEPYWRALLRGAYHLNQGPGMAAGNVVMGVLFTLYYLRRRRVMPLVVAHTLLDVVSFVGYHALPDDWLAALGVAG